MSAAAQLHELYTLIHPDRGRDALSRPLLKLLADTSPHVLGKVLGNLHVVISRSRLDAGAQRDFCVALVRAEAGFGHRWRLSCALAEAVPALAEVVPPDLLHELVLPILFRYLDSGAYAVKDVAADALCAVFRKLKKERQRSEVGPVV